MKEPKERIAAQHLVLSSGIDLLQASYHRQHFNRHAHDGYAFGIITRGQLDFFYRHQNWHALPGDINLVVPGEVHDGQAKNSDGWDYRMIYLPPSILENAFCQLTGRNDLPWFLPGSIVQSPLAAPLASLHACLSDAETGPLQKESALLCWLTAFIQRYNQAKISDLEPGAEPLAIARVLDYMQTEFAHVISLQTLANIAHLSPYHLLRVFEKTMGLPPHLYQQQLRIQKAKQLLATGHPLAVTALSTGFFDQSHFCRQFKKITGLTPAGYQKIMR